MFYLCCLLGVLWRHPTCKSLSHSEFIFVCGVKMCFNVICMRLAVQLSQHYLLKRLSFLLRIFLLCQRYVDTTLRCVASHLGSASRPTDRMSVLCWYHMFWLLQLCGIVGGLGGLCFQFCSLFSELFLASVGYSNLIFQSLVFRFFFLGGFICPLFIIQLWLHYETLMCCKPICVFSFCITRPRSLCR